MRDLLEQYKETRRHCRKMAEKAETAEDKTHWNAMGSHADFVIRWLETGRQPGNMRGIERRSVYDRTILVDPTDDTNLLLSYNPFDDMPGEKTAETREAEAAMVGEILSCLTDREWEIYEMRHARRMKRREIAEELGVTLGTVSRHLTRAEEKINQVTGRCQQKPPIIRGGTLLRAMFCGESHYNGHASRYGHDAE